MSAPTPAPGDDRPREGYYPDPSIPGYVRYWNGSAWVPGTSRPAPSDGEPLAPPSGARPAAPAVPLASVEETGPHFFDEDPAPAEQYGSRPEPADAWGADGSRQSGFGGEQDRGLSWGNPPGPDPRTGAVPPDARPAGADGAAGVPAAGPEPDRGADGGTFVFRRPTAGPASAAAPSAASGPVADDGTMTFRARDPRAPHQGGAPGAHPGAAGAPAGPGRGTPGTPGAPAAAGLGPQGPVGAAGAQGAAPAAGFGAQGPVGAPGAGAAAASGAGFGAPAAAPAPAAKPGFGAGKAAAERAAAAQAAQAQAPQGAQAPAVPAPAPAPQGAAGVQAAPPAAQMPAPSFPGPPQAAPGVPQQAAGPQPAAAQPVTPMSAGPGGGQPSWAQQVHRLAGSADDQPVAPWKPPVDDVFQAAARRQAAARPAGLGKRLAARAVDTLVLAAVTSAAAVPLGTKAFEHVDDKIEAAELTGQTVTVWLLDGTTSVYLGIVLAVLMVAGILYEALPTAKWGRTLGKKLFGLQVRDIEGHEPPSFGAALRRWLVYSVPGLLAVGVVGVLWGLFDKPWRQCWHDKAAHTFVAG
ncbi:RDD family protein [Streptomyces sp. NPDC017936]|uniref:RDD family protein n=1 Tax=Streptomyces sp. NPDC017936 TaxID=3365016 RepID=UPI0037A46B23